MTECHRPQFVVEDASFRRRKGLGQRGMGVPNPSRLDGKSADPVTGESKKHSNQNQHRSMAAILRAAETTVVEEKPRGGGQCQQGSKNSRGQGKGVGGGLLGRTSR